MKKIYTTTLLVFIVLNGFSQVHSTVFKNVYRGNSDTVKVNISPTRINGANNNSKSGKSSFQQTNYMNSFAMKDTSVLVKYSSKSDMPVFIETKGSSKKSGVSDTAASYAFLHAVKSYTRISTPEENFQISSIHYDKQNNTHVRFRQEYKGIEVYGSDFYVHLKKEKEQFTGRYKIIDSEIDMNARITEKRAVEIAFADLKTKTTVQELSDSQQELLNYSEPIVKLVIKESEGILESYNLVYEIHIRPNFMQEWIYFVDARTGSIVKSYDNTKYDGSYTALAYDLNDVLRTVNTYLEDGIYYLADYAEPMYDSDRNEGIIVTLDAQNTYDNINPVTSANNVWDNKAAVSAHYNTTVTYKYFYNTFSRNSINSQGGNIISVVNRADVNGLGWGNASWNGKFISFGNGGTKYKNLAEALDITAHEIGHGVIQNTANLIYQDQSGTINESYADIFAAMVDRDDWEIAEDIILSGIPMRDMSDPHNSGSSINDAGWQPSHMSEIVIGEELDWFENRDNGGVHINSGIPNYAFYLFATATSKEIAEQVYYHSLVNYLTSSSQFIDLRIAIIQSTTDLYGEESDEVLRAKIAFDAVGIYDDDGNNYLQDYPANTGNQLLCYYDIDPSHPSTFYASDIVGNGAVGLTNYLANSRLSITDDGTVGIYVSSVNTIHAIDLTTLEDVVIQDQQIWANAVISKDGNRLAAVTSVSDTAIWVYDFSINEWARFDLYNPTTSHGNESSSGVIFADALEFDVTGEYLVYDAYNVIPTDSGNDSIEYWDIGFINVWDNQTGNFGDGTIKKLYGTLPDKTSIGNPTFSKNSPYIIAFDYFDEIDNQFAIFGSNIVTGVTDLIALNNDIGFPSYTKDDDVLVFSALDGVESVVRGVILESNKISTSVSNNPVTLINKAKWGVCFADGVRDLGLPPIANFTASYKSGKAPLNVQFFDNSINDPTSWAWIFEGGTPATSTDINPVVTYATEGEYQVTLVVVNSFGDDTLSRQSYINVVATSLVVNTSSLEMSSDANSTASFTITSNTDWSISGLESWLSVNTSSGTGNATITLTAEENTSIESRTATLTISGTGVSDHSITITQSGVAVVFSVSETSLNIDADANSSATFNITTNTNWNITISDSWLTASSYSGSEDATITLTAEENTSTESRNATLTISGTGVSDQSVTVTQSGMAIIFSVSESSLNIKVDANSTASFTITSNTDWLISGIESWLSVDVSSGTGDAIIILTAEENTSTEPRIATLIISGTVMSDQTILVTQEGAQPYLNLSTSILSIQALEGSTATFDIYSNTAWTVSSSEAWLTASQNVGSDTVIITLSSNVNISATQRHAVISVSGTDIETKDITVTQDGAEPTLTLSSNLIIIEGQDNSTATFQVYSNTNWSVTTIETWLSITPISGTDTATISITATANETIAVRTTTITVSASDVPDQSVSVNQNGAVGVNEDNNESINLYPNPSSEILHVEGLQNNTIGRIYNATGQLIYNSEIDALNGEINVTGLPAGLYILKMNVDDGVVAKRFMKK